MSKQKPQIELILQHIIVYWFEKDGLTLNDTDREHIEVLIKEGYREGELNQLVSGQEIRGWWSIKQGIIN